MKLHFRSIASEEVNSRVTAYLFFSGLFSSISAVKTGFKRMTTWSNVYSQFCTAICCWNTKWCHRWHEFNDSCACKTIASLSSLQYSLRAFISSRSRMGQTDSRTHSNERRQIYLCEDATRTQSSLVLKGVREMRKNHLSAQQRDDGTAVGRNGISRLY